MQIKPWAKFSYLDLGDGTNTPRIITCSIVNVQIHYVFLLQFSTKQTDFLPHDWVSWDASEQLWRKQPVLLNQSQLCPWWQSELCASVLG